jgi:glycosyltransferase involved in cell wall biosynthesis
MRIVFVPGSLELGGAEQQLVILANGLVRRGHEVHVVSLRMGGVLEEKAANGGVIVHQAPRNRVTNILGLPFRIRRLRPDLVHSYLPLANLLMVTTRWWYRGAPLVWGYRASDFSNFTTDRRDRLQDWLLGRLASRVDLTICNSRAGRDFVVGLGFPKDRVQVVSNGIDSNYFRPDPVSGEEFRSRYLHGTDCPVVGMLARWDAVKGHEDFLRMAARVLRSVPTAQFVAVGRHTEEDRREFLRVAEELGLVDHVVCVPEVSEPVGVLNAFDLLVSPSKSEGFPNVVAEAMACGVPAVTNGVGDARLIAGDLCPVVAVGDIEAMANAVIAVLEGERPSANALRSAVLEKFSVERLVSRSEELLNDEFLGDPIDRSLEGDRQLTRDDRFGRTQIAKDGLSVALVGNMNNNFFALARYLRDSGLDAVLMPFANEDDHFSPLSDIYPDSAGVDVIQLPVVGFLHVVTRRRQLRRILAPFDFVVGCGMAPAMCTVIGRRLDVFAPYGSDLSELSVYNRTNLRPWFSGLPRFVRSVLAVAGPFVTFLQRRGIAKCRAVHMCSSPPIHEELVEDLPGNGVRIRTPLPMVYAPEYSSDRVTRYGSLGGNAERFEHLREESSFMVIAHGRQHWGPNSDENAKGNDRLIYGWSSFVRETLTSSPQLVLFEYGRDIERSKALAVTLNCESSVTWMPLMPRKELMYGIQLSDVVCGEFQQSWLTAGVFFEALIMEKPLISYRDTRMYEEAGVVTYPILNAREPREIADRLHESVQNPKRLMELGSLGREWYESQVKESLDQYQRLLDDLGHD